MESNNDFLFFVEREPPQHDKKITKYRAGTTVLDGGAGLLAMLGNRFFFFLASLPRCRPISRPSPLFARGRFARVYILYKLGPEGVVINELEGRAPQRVIADVELTCEEEFMLEDGEGRVVHRPGPGGLKVRSCHGCSNRRSCSFFSRSRQRGSLFLNALCKGYGDSPPPPCHHSGVCTLLLLCIAAKEPGVWRGRRSQVHRPGSIGSDVRASALASGVFEEDQRTPSWIPRVRHFVLTVFRTTR